MNLNVVLGILISLIIIGWYAKITANHHEGSLMTVAKNLMIVSALAAVVVLVIKIWF
jgi:hypothetical protein